MPTKWISPKKFLTHKGVTIYHVYKNDEIDQGARIYWYGWCEDCYDDRNSFDVRDLPNPNQCVIETVAGRKALLREAIDAGILTDEGVTLPEDEEPPVTISVPRDAWRVLKETLLLDAKSSAFDVELRSKIQQALAGVLVLNAPVELTEAARDVLEWAERMGGWEAPCWVRLRSAVRGAFTETESGDVTGALRRIHDILYLDMDGKREFYNPDKSWDADTLSAIADIVRPLFPLTPWKHEDEEPGT